MILVIIMGDTMMSLRAIIYMPLVILFGIYLVRRARVAENKRYVELVKKWASEHPEEAGKWLEWNSKNPKEARIWLMQIINNGEAK